MKHRNLVIAFKPFCSEDRFKAYNRYDVGYAQKNMTRRIASHPSKISILNLGFNPESERPYTVPLSKFLISEDAPDLVNLVTISKAVSPSRFFKLTSMPD